MRPGLQVSWGLAIPFSNPTRYRDPPGRIANPVWIGIQRKALAEPLDKLTPLSEENNELISIFVASIATAQKNLEKQ